MMAADFPVITVLILFPILGCVGLFFIKRPHVVRAYALGISMVELVLALPLLGFQLSTSDFQFVERVPWVPGWRLEYFVGLDGISLLMVGLTLIIFPLCVLC
ncbi:MAG: NADH-quinone oxidoreductase subunit M, partial [Desulfobacteraceae bacterium]|nr:NADH-quinone oxidoreductase subunit M [Desulfobacteraceae bacterium]